MPTGLAEVMVFVIALYSEVGCRDAYALSCCFTMYLGKICMEFYLVEGGTSTVERGMLWESSKDPSPAAMT